MYDRLISLLMIDRFLLRLDTMLKGYFTPFCADFS